MWEYESIIPSYLPRLGRMIQLSVTYRTAITYKYKVPYGLCLLFLLNAYVHEVLNTYLSVLQPFVKFVRSSIHPSIHSHLPRRIQSWCESESTWLRLVVTRCSRILPRFHIIPCLPGYQALNVYKWSPIPPSHRPHPYLLITPHLRQRPHAQLDDEG